MERLSIGQMAKLNNVSKQTLRYYDKIKLLEPQIVDEETGYRYYNITQSARLDMIQYMKSVGMSLKEIQTQIQRNDPHLIQEVLQANWKMIDEEIQRLTYQKRAVERTLKSYERYESSPGEGTITLEFIEKRQLYLTQTDLNFYDYDLAVYEKLLRALKQKLIEDHLPQIYFCNAGTVVRKERLVAREYFSNEIFVFVEDTYVDRHLITEIPSNMYLCIYCDAFEKERAYMDLLLEHVNRQGYEIIGDYICEVIAELPLMKDTHRGMYLRLQIPVKISKNASQF